jgi:hypothetical protein
MIPSFDLDKTATFFKDILGFGFAMDSSDYKILWKNNLTIHLLPAGEDIGQMEFYLEVDDLESLWSEMKDKVKGLKVREPFDRPYGMREIHVGVPFTNTLLFIGQEIQAGKTDETDETGKTGDQRS